MSKMILNFTRTCIVCGKTYTPSGLSQKFCPACSPRIKKALRHEALEEEKHCLCCGKPFKPTRVGHMYCSKSCYWRHHRNAGKESTEKTCEHCGKTFVTWSTIKRFCSRECQKTHHAMSQKVPAHTCARCGKVITGRGTNAKWCIECLAIVNAPHPVEPRTCIVCGTVFVPRGHRTTTCSRECARIRHSITTMQRRQTYAKAPEKPKRQDAYKKKIDNAVIPDFEPFAAEDTDDMIYGNMIYL